MAKKKINPLDAFKTTKSTPSKSSKTKKNAAKVTTEVMNAVDVVNDTKIELKRLAVVLEENEKIIIDAILPQHEEQARAGNFSKSWFVEGRIGNLIITWANKFSIVKDQKVYDEIKKVVGAKLFGLWLAFTRTVALKTEAQEDADKMQKLFDAMTEKGLDPADYFEKKEVLKVLEGVDKGQFTLTKSKLDIFRTLAVQAKPSLK